MYKTGCAASKWAINLAASASLLLFHFAPLTVQSAPASFSPSKPNIIFILADDLGYGDLGCYGQTKIKTPNIDKLASEGIRFTSVYAGSTVCAPSRCALMTGLHSGHGTIRGNGHNLALGPGDVTVAEILKQAGYRTALIGKWGLGELDSPGMPGKKGFDEFAGYLNQTHAHDYYTDHLFRSGPRVPVPEGETVLRQSFPENNADSRKSMRPGTPKIYMPDLFASAAQNYVRQNKPDHFNPNPFFLYFATITPHANNEEGRLSGNGMQVPSDAPYSKEPWPQVQKNKAAMITRMDDDIGKLMAQLQRLKIDSNTIVFFASDNGPHQEGGVDPKFFNSSGPFRGIKRDLSEGGIRVPMIVRWPAAIKPGQVSDTPWAFWDVLPTLAEIASAKTPMNLDGISMVPTLLGQKQTNLHSFYWEFHERGFQQAARMDNFKAIKLDPDEPLALYDLATDLGEKQNIADKHPDLVAKFETFLKSARTPSDKWPIKKRLKAKG